MGLQCYMTWSGWEQGAQLHVAAGAPGGPEQGPCLCHLDTLEPDSVVGVDVLRVGGWQHLARQKWGSGAPPLFVTGTQT